MRALTSRLGVLLLLLLSGPPLAGAGELAPLVPPPHDVLVLGDGLAIEGLGEALNKALRRKGEVDVTIGPSADVGLTTPREFDWAAALDGALQKVDPTVLVLVVGRNDRQALRDLDGRPARGDGGGRLEDPARLYEQRVRGLLTTRGTDQRPIFLVAAPPAKPRAGRKHPWVEGALEGACGATAGCTFVGHAFVDPSPGAAAKAVVEALGTRLSWERAPEPTPEPVEARWNDDGELILPAEFSEDQLQYHASAVRGRDVYFWAFVPRPERPGDTFPVLYLLHGAWGSHDDWRQNAQDQLKDLAERYGVIIITPDGDPFGWYLDSPVDAASQLETWFIRELIPHVEGASRLPVMKGPEHRAIAGLSMGGHGAFVLALRNPRAFVSASSMSGILDITRHPTSWELPDRLGPLDRGGRSRWDQHSATVLLRSVPEPETRLLFTVSTGDSAAYAENEALHEELTRRGVPHEYAEAPGGHTWQYWVSVIADHVAFHAEYLSGDGVR